MNKIYTIGHSTRSIEELVRLLKMHKIKNLVDIRKIAKSRHNPQFEKEFLENSLKKSNIKYTRMENLGGFRKSTISPVNLGWRNKSFRSYADYMQTEDFNNSIKELISIAKKERAVIMCAEAVPWRCHRSLVADALVVRGFEVSEIISKSNCQPHKLTSFASVSGTKLTYPSID